jgi:hypothetical protein
MVYMQAAAEAEEAAEAVANTRLTSFCKLLCGYSHSGSLWSKFSLDRGLVEFA